MKPLSKKYQESAESIKEAIQASDELATYLSNEEEEDYAKLQAKFEKQINDLHEEVAAQDPLQLFSLEDTLIDPGFEGLFFPRILGYAVLRGDTNEQFKYVRPQEHFKKVLLAICNSMYFDIIKRRVGQAIQIGFALSSDIWITNLVDEVDNKHVKQFLMTQKMDKYRVEKNRRSGYVRFKKQFQTTNFESTEFPGTPGEMATGFGSVRKFLEYRISTKADHSSYLSEILKVLENKDLAGTQKYVHLMGLVINFIDFRGEMKDSLKKVLNEQRKKDANFNERYFVFLNELLQSSLPVDADCDTRVHDLLDMSIHDDMQQYYDALNELAKKGFVHEEAQEAVRKLYAKYDGLSMINGCLRLSVLNQFVQVLRNLTEAEYPDYFELNKTFVTYMDIFDYQQFNQWLKEDSLKYVKKLLKKYTDKRGRDYQDIKKFVIPTFQDLGFMKEKEVLELFKTRRKRKKATA